MNVVLDIAAVIGVAAILTLSTPPWLALTYPAFIAAWWRLQHFYLSTSHQMRLLDIESKARLYSHLLDTVSSL